MNSSQPSSVTPRECSNCADKDLSRVTAVHPSGSILTAYLPAFIIGSIVKNIPFCRTAPMPAVP